MAIRRGKPVNIRTVGVSDTLDGTNAFPGAMAALTNLIPAPGSTSIFVPRPASESIYTFSDFTSPGQGTALLVVGTRAYGMINGGGTFAGYDVPFCFDILNGTDISITGYSIVNLPHSVSNTGNWTPPTMAVVGTKVVVTHPGFDGVTNFFGWIDISTFAVPAWDAGNTSVHPLIAVPVAVGQFNGRAYYAVNNTTVFSDSLNATVVTNADQALTLGDNTLITAFGGQPLSQLTGGVVQSLIAFKGAASMFQITGDQATSNLQVNQINVNTGTLAPNTICSTPLGVAFMSPDGLRFIDYTARVSDPIGYGGQGVTLPFINAIFPTRMAAAFGNNVYRISVQNGAESTQPLQEYWFDIARKIWTGPHSFPATLIQAYPDGQSFVMFAQGTNPIWGGFTWGDASWGASGILWESPIVPNINSSYVENGTNLSWTWESSLLPDNQQMVMNSIVETALACQFSTTPPIVQVFDDSGTLLDTSQINIPVGIGSSEWGSFVWGEADWGTQAAPFKQNRIAWHLPIVAKQMSLRITGQSDSSTALGNLYVKIQPLGYLLEDGL